MQRRRRSRRSLSAGISNAYPSCITQRYFKHQHSPPPKCLHPPSSLPLGPHTLRYAGKMCPTLRPGESPRSPSPPGPLSHPGSLLLSPGGPPRRGSTFRFRGGGEATAACRAEHSFGSAGAELRALPSRQPQQLLAPRLSRGR